MIATDSTHLTDLDRLLFHGLMESDVQTPLSLTDLIAPFHFGRDEVSQSLGRMVRRGLVIELPGRRFYPPITVAEPAGFSPLTESEWSAAAPGA